MITRIINGEEVRMDPGAVIGPEMIDLPPGRMLDLFCGRWGWSRAFAARGWLCFGVDLTPPPETPRGCAFTQGDVLLVTAEIIKRESIDFICASSPCEQFSVHGMKHFHPNPPYPELGIKLFNHARSICEASGVPYVMENVRAAQQFVGQAVNHCGPFYLWGTGVPAILPQGISKGMDTAGSMAARGATRDEIREYAKLHGTTGAFNSKSKERKEITAKNATIPPELASCVADYAEYLVRERVSA